MRFRSHQCWFPRDVEKPLEYEDASAHSEKWGRAVIADGVSSAIFSRTWARLLTRTAVVNPPALDGDEEIKAWLQPLQQAWKEEIRQAKISVPLWAVMPKINSIGGQATLLIVEIEPRLGEDGTAGDTYRLRARGIGDSVLYVIRGGEKVLSFPITESAAFEQPPWVLSSIARDVAYAEKVQHLETECRVGDLLVLCTDAIGKWSMREYESGRAVDWMRYWGNDDALHADVVRLRDQAATEQGTRLVVDDCTLLLLQVVSESSLDGEPDAQPDKSDEPFSLLWPPAGPAVAMESAPSTVEGENSTNAEPAPDAVPTSPSGPPVAEAPVPGAAPESTSGVDATTAPAEETTPTAAAAGEAQLADEPESGAGQSPQPADAGGTANPCESVNAEGDQANGNKPEEASSHSNRRGFIDSLAKFFGGRE
jgi:hypothetical protein